MRTDRLSKTCTAFVVLLAAGSLAACGSSNKKGGSTIKTDGGAGAGGSSGSGSGGTGGQATGGTGGQGTAGTGGQAAGGAGGQGAGGAGSCSDLGPTASCKTCLQKNCCAESAACAASADCKAFVQCSESCTPYYDTTTACSKACQSKYPNGPGTAFNALILCTKNNCASDCTYP